MRCPQAVSLTVLAALVAVAGCSPTERDDARTPPAATRGPAVPPAGRPGGAPALSELPGTRPDAPGNPPAGGRAPADRLPVDTRRLTLNRGGNRPLPVTVWYPTRGATGRFPVVLFSHGLGGRPADYAKLLSAWASAGFVVAAPAYPLTSRGAQLNPLDVLNQPADASFVLDAVLALDRQPGDRLRGRLDVGRVAAAGHSAGAITTVGMFTGGQERRLRAGIVLAGSAIGFGTNFTGPAVPLMFVHGEQDDVVSYATGKALYDAVPWPKALLSLPGGGHAIDPGDRSFQLVSRSTTNFLRWSLYGDRAARGRLAAGTGGRTATFDDRL